MIDRRLMIVGVAAVGLARSAIANATQGSMDISIPSSQRPAM